MTTTLVTGGMGFIGLHLVRSLLDAGHDVVLTWNRSWRTPDPWKDELGKRVIAERVDVSNQHEVAAVALTHKVDGIVHLAAPGLGASPPTQDYATNMQGLVNVIEAARLVNARRLTYVSSSTIYMGLPHGPYREDTPLPLESVNATATFKKAGEILLLHYADRYKLDVGIVRPRAVYGPLYYSMSNLPSRISHAAARNVAPDYGPAGTPYADDTGDFTHVADCTEVVKLVHLADTLKHRTYNVGGGRAFSMQELADAAQRAAPGANIPLQPGQSAAGSLKDNYLDLTRVKEDFGFIPRYPAAEAGIAHYIDWLKTHDQ